MRVIQNTKFMPLLTRESAVESYSSIIRVEIDGEIFTAIREMTPKEYEETYPVLRDFIHDSLRTDIMTQIRKKLFEGVTS